MKKILLLIFIAALVGLLPACQDGDTVTTVAPPVETDEPDNEPTKYDDPVNGSGDILHVDSQGGNGYFAYTHDVGTTPKDVFLIFTNTSKSSHSSAPQVRASQNFDPPQASSRIFTQDSNDLFTQDLRSYAKDRHIGLRGTPKATIFNAKPLSAHPSPKQQLVGSQTTKPRFQQVGDTNDFMNNSRTDTIPSTLRKVITDGTITLNMWVGDNSWGDCVKDYCLDQNILDSFGQKFLQEGETNDIFDWVTNIHGTPWGAHDYTNQLVGEEAATHIDILFYDIDNDNSTIGGVLGFFWAKDLFKTSVYDFSNERLMFYIDSVLTATPEGSWDITDEWPAEMLATLGHEFQHMIQFYQKTVMATQDGAESDVWISEMSAMITEDLISEKLGIVGPRGIDPTDGTEGPANNELGRLPLFNESLDIGVSQWLSGYNVLRSYSISFAFGSYLARNFGGPELFRKITQNAQVDYLAVENAVKAMGYDETFDSLLQKWAVAVILSDFTEAPEDYRYNTGDYFTYELDGTTYNLGSINLYQFKSGSHTGPVFNDENDLEDLSLLDPISNLIVKSQENVTGNYQRQISMSSPVKLTVLTR